MTNLDWIVLIVIGIVSAGLVILMLALIMSIIEDKSSRSKREKFSEYFKSSIAHSQPTWEQVLDMAETSEVSISDVFKISRLLLRDILSGKDTELEIHRDLIESYISKHRHAEPFEGLPSEMRVHLERLRDALNEKSHLLEPLTAQIRELVSIYEKDKRHQRRYTAWGFVVGLLGLIFAAYAYVNPVGGQSISSPPGKHFSAR